MYTRLYTVHNRPTLVVEDPIHEALELRRTCFTPMNRTLQHNVARGVGLAVT